MMGKNAQLSSRLKRFESNSSVKEIIAVYNRQTKEVEAEMEKMRVELINVLSGE